jgi:hypothetical protein
MVVYNFVLCSVMFNASLVLTSVHMANRPNIVALNWNVCGLNNPMWRQVVRGLVSDHKYMVVCLQETKL